MAEHDVMHCPVYVGRELLSNKTLLTQHIKGHQVLIVTQKNIASFYLAPLQKLLQSYQCDVFFLPEGEDHKTPAEWLRILDTLILHQHERSTTLIALGGGMVGDMTGFAAACYQRGVAYIQIPTSLIAQADAAIGSKTAINHPQGKNMMGAFYAPECVIVDIDTLLTLPSREYVSGLAEVIKYGLIWDAAFFAWFEKNKNRILQRESDVLQQMVERCIAIKTTVVQQDPRDQGLRQILNFGHTFGHALEACLQYKNILHGEAVAVGMVIAIAFSKSRGFLSDEIESRIYQLLHSCGLFEQVPKEWSMMDLVSWMSQDKKNTQGHYNLILLESIGKAIKLSGVSSDEIKKIPAYARIFVTT